MYIPHHKKTPCFSLQMPRFVLAQFFRALYHLVFKIYLCQKCQALTTYQKLLHPETFSANTMKSCRKSIPARKCTSVFTDDNKAGEKLPNFEMQSYLDPVFRHAKLWPGFRVQEKYNHFTKKSGCWALKFMQPNRHSVICQKIHHIDTSKTKHAYKFSS